MGYDEISGEEKGEDSASIRARVVAAREVQNARYKGTGISCNARLTSAALRRVCPLSAQANTLLRRAFTDMGLSARAYDRLLKVSRTIADLDGSERIEASHISEAIQYRSLDRKYWYSR